MAKKTIIAAEDIACFFGTCAALSQVVFVSDTYTIMGAGLITVGLALILSNYCAPGLAAAAAGIILAAYYNEPGTITIMLWILVGIMGGYAIGLIYQIIKLIR